MRLEFSESGVFVLPDTKDQSFSDHRGLCGRLFPLRRVGASHLFPVNMKSRVTRGRVIATWESRLMKTSNKPKPRASTGHDPIPRFSRYHESGHVGSRCLETSRVGSGPIEPSVFQISRIRSGRVRSVFNITGLVGL